MKISTFEIPQLRLLRIAGADAIKVLNGLCTAKLVELKAGDTTEAMFTDDRGRVLAHGVMAMEPDQSAIWFVGQAFDAAQLTAHIDRFIFREDAQPKDVTGLWRGQLIDVDASRDDWSALALAMQVNAEAGCAPLTIQDQAAWLIRLPIIGPHARLLLVPQAFGSALPNWLTGLALSLGEADEFEDRRIRNFWPMAGNEFNERTLPQELDRDTLAISFTKGCYLGQETVARLDAMGQVQKKLCLVELYGSAEMVAGLALTREDKEVGKLNSMSPRHQGGKRLALATMRRGSIDAGSQFQVLATADAQPIGTGVVIAHP